MIKAFTYLQFRPRDHWLSSLINNGNTRKISEICSKLTIKATNRCLFQTQEYVLKEKKANKKTIIIKKQNAKITKATNKTLKTIKKHLNKTKTFVLSK